MISSDGHSASAGDVIGRLTADACRDQWCFRSDRSDRIILYSSDDDDTN